MDSKQSDLTVKMDEMRISETSNKQSDLSSGQNFDSAFCDVSGSETAPTKSQQPRTTRSLPQPHSNTVLDSARTDSGYEATASNSTVLSTSPKSPTTKSRPTTKGIFNRFDRKYIEESLDWFMQDTDGDNDLMIAIMHPDSKQHQQIVQIICDNASTLDLLNLRNNRGVTAVHFAALSRNLPALHRLRLAGADPNIPDYLGSTAVHLAAIRGDCELLKTLVQDLDESELQQYNQVYHKSRTARARQIECKKVNVNARNCDGKSPIYLAVEHEHAEVLALLLTYGADPNLKENSAGCTSLHAAVEQRSLPCLEKLVQSPKTEVNARTYAGLTALDLAERLSQPAKDRVLALLNPLDPEHGDGNSEDLSSLEDEDAMEDDFDDADNSIREEMAD